MDLVALLISVISGAVGGNIAGAAMQNKSLGTLGNSIAGVLGGVGGAVLLIIISLIKGTMAKA